MKPAHEPKFSKRKSYSKNKKKSWRGIDISTTEEFLHDERFQLRTEGELIADKSNEQLFIVERGAKVADHPSANKVPRRSVKELKCYSILKNTSKIPPPRKEYPTDPNIEEKVLRRELRSLRAIQRNNVPSSVNTTVAPLDLWGKEEKQEGEEFYNIVTKKQRIKPPQNIRKNVSGRQAVESPLPGQSVNPAYDDHQDLLLQAYLVEKKKEKQERKVYNALDAKFPYKSEAPNQATWLAEMSGCLFEEKLPADDEVADTGHISLNPPVSRDRKKTRSQRRKEKEAKLVAKELEKKKEIGARENKIFSIGRIKSEIAKKTREEKRRQQVREKKMELKKVATKRLGKTKFVTPDLELKLTTELVGNLRSVKPEGSLLVDRFKSLQARNVIEPRTKVSKKKVKTKKFEKKSFRELKP